MPSFRDLTRNRDFTRLWIGTSISQVGTGISALAFPLLAFALTHDTTKTALCSACYWVGLLAMLLPAGAMADRYDRKSLMRVSALVGAIAYATLAVAALLHRATLPHAMAVSLVTGIAEGLFGPAESSAIRSVVSSEELPTALSQNQAREHIASLVSGPVGGALFSLGRAIPFVVDAASYAVNWVLLAGLRTDLSPTRSDAPPTKAWKAVIDGFHYIGVNPFQRVIAIWAPLTNLAANAIFYLATYRLIAQSTPPWQIGLIETVAGCAGIVGAAVAPWIVDRMPTGWLTILAAWSFVPLLVPMAIWGNVVVICAAVAVALLINPAGNVGIGAYYQAAVPRELLGRVNSTSQFLGFAGMWVAPLLAGVLLATLGGRDGMLAMAVVSAAVALIPTISRTVRTIPRPAVWRASLVD